MKKLLVIGLLLGSQMSYASLRNNEVDVIKRKSNIVGLSGCVMATIGVAMIIAGATLENNNCGKSELGAACIAVGLPCLAVGAFIAGYVVRKEEVEQKSQRDCTKLGDPLIHRSGTEHV